jgi:predicted MFS family arabinose efflux permease
VAGHTGPDAGLAQAVPAAQRATPAPEAATGGIPGKPDPAAQSALRRTASVHRLRNAGHTGEWGPVSPSGLPHVPGTRKPLLAIGKGLGLLHGGFGWMLAAWIPAYAGSAIVFALYPVLFQHAFHVKPQTSSLAFAIIVFVSLPLFIVAGRVSQRRGPRAVMAGGLGARVVLLAILAILAAAGSIPAAAPLAVFGGILFAWSFLSVASPGLTGQFVPQAEGEAQGVLNAASGVAGFAGAVIGGAVASAAGYPAALTLGAAATGLGLLIFTAKFLRPRKST